MCGVNKEKRQIDLSSIDALITNGTCCFTEAIIFGWLKSLQTKLQDGLRLQQLH